MFREGIMILGMSISTFTTLHVVISLIGIFSGFIVLYGLFGARKFGGWTALFLVATVLTSVTGFLFPFTTVLPSHIVGVISLIVLAVAIYAFYGGRLAGRWRWIYVVTALTALYLNVFVGVVQAFQKVPFLSPLAPTQSELPFVIAQLGVIAIFIVLGILSVRRYRPEVKVPA
jgi:hypothetical protein